MERWTRLTLRYRWLLAALWLAIAVAGAVASTRVSGLLSNTFAVPGTGSARANAILERHFGESSFGEYLVVFLPHGTTAPSRLRLEAAIRRAATAVPTATAGPLYAAPRDHVIYGSVRTRLSMAAAKRETGALRRALRAPPSVTAYVTGQPAIQHDLDPVFSRDLARGESFAIPIALLVLVAVFGVSPVATMPFVFAGATIFGTIGIVDLVAHAMQMATYVTNLVQLIGLGIAIDYCLLVVYRFREEIARGGSVDDAIVRTMQTAGRAVVFSGTTVAIGLALLLFIPVPFMRSMGVGGFLIPVVSVLAALTLQAPLLSFYGARGTRRLPVARLLRRRLRLPLPRLAGEDVEHGFWARLAHLIMRRPSLFLATGVAVLVALAVPVYALQLTPGSTTGIPQSLPSVRGLNVLSRAIGAGALDPTQIVIDAGRGRSVRGPQVEAAVSRLVRRLRSDPEVARVHAGTGPQYVSAGGRYEQIVVAGKHEYGSEAAQSFVHRLRNTLVPAARFPPEAQVDVGGGPAQGVDFLRQSYRYLPWLVLGVVALTYLVLMRAFRSLLLPLKAVLLNMLSVAASYGALVLVFRFGVGQDVAGLYRFPQVEGWIPIFLFAMLFGLSMDYEVFLVSRMRESWDERLDNEHAVAVGLEQTGRIITAAATIMVAAFAGFVAGSVVGLQEFGIGLAVAVFVDATIVRALLVPALMTILGGWNWWLPRRAARVARVEPSPLLSVRERPSAPGGASRRPRAEDLCSLHPVDARGRAEETHDMHDDAPAEEMAARDDDAA